MWRIKRRRTKPIENKENSGVLYPKFNATAKSTRYVNRNNYLDVNDCTVVCHCSEDAFGQSYRNPVLGYRKCLVDCSGLSGCGYTKYESGNVYKDNYAKTCSDPSNSLVCYNPSIKKKQNMNGCVNESYNYSTKQYLDRRCLTFSQQEFNFQSQVPVDTGGTKFASCANCQYNSPCSSHEFDNLLYKVKNNKCYVVYKRSNSKFNKQGAVSGGSRINRLKYQTKIVAQSRKVNGQNNVINGKAPASNYVTSKPLTLTNTGCVNPPPGPIDLFGISLSIYTLTVNWSTDNIDESCNIGPLTGFTIQRTGSPFGHTVTISPESRNYTYTGIVTGRYDIRIKSNSYRGSSDWTYLKNLIVSPPFQITDLSGVPAPNQVTLNWTAPGSGVSPITDYQYKQPCGEWISVGNTLSITITQLVNGTKYTFMVRAVNIWGNGVSSDRTSYTPSTIPYKINDLSGVARDKHVSLSWTAPDNGGSDITDYQYNINGGTWVHTGSTNPTFNIEGLSNRTLYTFSVRAINVIGGGPDSNKLELMPTTIPGTIDNLSGIAADNQVTLNWTSPENGGSTIIDYEYKQPCGNWVKTQSTNTTFIVNGLTNGIKYTFMVRAVNINGSGPISNRISFIYIAKPKTITHLSGNGEDAQVVLSWLAPENGGSVITDYQYNINGGSWISTGSNSTSHTVTGLTNGESYIFKVFAVNIIGNGTESGPVTVKPNTIPGAITNLSGVQTYNTVTLTWDKSNDGGASITKYEYNINGNWVTTVPISPDITTYLVTGLTSATKYTFMVRDVNANGPGINNHQINVTTLTVPSPVNVNGTNNEDGKSTVSWTANPSVSGYKLEYATVTNSSDEKKDYGWIIVADDIVSNMYTVTGLTNFTKAYSFRVSSKISDNLSIQTYSPHSYTPRDLQLPQSLEHMQSYLQSGGKSIYDLDESHGWYTMRMACFSESNETQWNGQGLNSGMEWHHCVGKHLYSEPSNITEPGLVRNPFILVTNSTQVIYKINPRGSRSINDVTHIPTFYGPGFSTAGVTSVSYFDRKINPPYTNPPSGCVGGGEWYNEITSEPYNGNRRIIDDCRLNFGHDWHWITGPKNDYSFGNRNSGPDHSLYTQIKN